MYIFMKNLILIIILVISLVWNWYLLFDKYNNTKKEISQENKGEKNDEKYILD